MTNKYGEILSYRPYINYHKEKSNYFSSNNETNIAIVDYIDNIPSNNVIKMNNIIFSAQGIMNNLKNTFIEEKYMGFTFLQYVDLISDNKNNSSDNIYNNAIDDIKSNIVIEVYKQLNDEIESIYNFNKLYKKINFGNDEINLEEVIELCNDNVKTISSLVNTNPEKINFASMNYESKLNKLVEIKLELSDVYINNLNSIAISDISQDDVISNKDVKIGMNLLFNDINNKYKDLLNKFEVSNSYENFSKLYSNISLKLTDLYEMLSLKKSLFENAGNEFCTDIENYIIEKGDEIDADISNMYKGTAGSSIIENNFLDILNRKDIIKKAYSQGG